MDWNARVAGNENVVECLVIEDLVGRESRNVFDRRLQQEVSET